MILMIISSWSSYPSNTDIMVIATGMVFIVHPYFPVLSTVCGVYHLEILLISMTMINPIWYKYHIIHVFVACSQNICEHVKFCMCDDSGQPCQVQQDSCWCPGCTTGYLGLVSLTRFMFEYLSDIWSPTGAWVLTYHSVLWPIFDSCLRIILCCVDTWVLGYTELGVK